MNRNGHLSSRCGCARPAAPQSRWRSPGGDGRNSERSWRDVLHAAALSSLSLSSPRITILSASPPWPSQVVVRREPSRVGLISIVGRSTFRAELRTFESKERGGHASASNFPELCNSDGLRHHPSKYRVFARVSGNVGTTKGLHARRLAAMWCANPRCGQDRGLLTAKYSATQRSVPRGF